MNLQIIYMNKKKFKNFFFLTGGKMLKKLFIKNYKNINNKEIRNKYGIVAGLFGVISNAIIAAIKLIIGFISNSMSICIEGVKNDRCDYRRYCRLQV